MMHEGGAKGSREHAMLQILAASRLKQRAHVCDAGCVESQRLIKRQRTLPSQKGALYVC